ncbi:hypothetical protein RDE2_40990 [Rhodococcus sp. RDE2]|nr:hypothetical protein RDE2_40990 [Rhodococcus sp. RDE2]
MFLAEGRAQHHRAACAAVGGKVDVAEERGRGIAEPRRVSHIHSVTSTVEGVKEGVISRPRLGP